MVNAQRWELVPDGACYTDLDEVFEQVSLDRSVRIVLQERCEPSAGQVAGCCIGRAASTRVCRECGKGSGCIIETLDADRLCRQIASQ